MNKIVALASAKVTTFVPTKNADRARTFYEGTLGLAFRGDDSFALIFDLNGASLRIVRVENFAPAPFTVLGWDIVDIASTAKQLRDSGVTFQKYPGLEQDENSVWTSPNGTKVAWFKDPDGNVLSISQTG